MDFYKSVITWVKPIFDSYNITNNIFFPVISSGNWLHLMLQQVALSTGGLVLLIHIGQTVTEKNTKAQHIVFIEPVECVVKYFQPSFNKSNPCELLAGFHRSADVVYKWRAVQRTPRYLHTRANGITLV